ncbi:hypothetical protein OCU04_008358 [Sclerotinia nivalis]|uniref:Uncharacterized protein n=1 Tax=Sclerotinia nivalis TaxID=352851 RepID=A0A9X0AHX7_9HELO|nr:hypothetical protein OCU04_008358 [Sclerotinia nivalis]
MNDSGSDDSVDLREKNEELRKENEELRKELKASTLHLAELAHKEYQVPDGSIREDYQKICRAIETWIDYAEPGDFRNRFKETLKTEERTHKLSSIGIDYQLPAASDPKLDLLKSLDMLHYFILSLTIGKYVFFEVLMKPYPVGVTEPQQAMFLSIEKEMSRTGKAKSRIKQWRSDTLTALCATRSYKDKQVEQLSRIQDALEKDLSFWYGNSSSARLKARLRTEILEPSIKVHLEMQCSTQRYELIDERDVQFEPSSSKGQHLPHEVKEITTWKTITSDGTEESLQCLYPGLVVYATEAAEKSQLVEPIMAVFKGGTLPQARHSGTSSSANFFSQRAESATKETREYRHPKTAVGASSKRFSGFFLNAWIESNRKSGDNRQSPERTSRTRRSPEPSSSQPNLCASLDTSSKEIHYTSSSYDQTMSYPQPSQPIQDWPASVQASPTPYTRTLYAEPNEEGKIIVETQYGKMAYTSSPGQPSGYYYGRPSVPDGT